MYGIDVERGDDVAPEERCACHATAMRQARTSRCRVKTYGFESDMIPDWDEALPLERKRLLFDNRPKDDKVATNRCSGLHGFVVRKAATVARRNDDYILQFYSFKHSIRNINIQTKTVTFKTCRVGTIRIPCQQSIRCPCLASPTFGRTYISSSMSVNLQLPFVT